RIRIRHVHRVFLFEPLLYHVSVFALNKIRDELIKASSATPDSPLKPCTGTFRSMMGLPCSHTIYERLEANQALQKADIHEHWWIQGRHIEFLDPTDLLEELVNTPPIVLENPATKKPRGRPVSARNKNKRTMQRDLSAFDHVEK
ncbi:15429_t:CDS:2, partial [Gigaspora rosea]